MGRKDNLASTSEKISVGDKQDSIAMSVKIRIIDFNSSSPISNVEIRDIGGNIEKTNLTGTYKKTLHLSRTKPQLTLSFYKVGYRTRVLLFTRRDLKKELIVTLEPINKIKLGEVMAMPYSPPEKN